MSQVVDLWTSFCRATLDCLYPPRCPLCGLFAEASPCPSCVDEMQLLDPPLTRRPNEPYLDYRIAIYKYEGRAAQAVQFLKYRRQTALVEFMALQIYQAYENWSSSVDLIVPVPVHRARRRQRGFNQSELLSEKLPTSPGMLHRIRNTRPQVGLDRTQREQNLLEAFRANPQVAGKTVLLVDDVLTSGHTARECAKALKKAQAIEVGILAFAGEV
jgi:ComF family protein